jgi:riboflavin kinase/FMN adenylyltransferase
VRLIRLSSRYITRILEEREPWPAPALSDCALALGAFDGLHLGHQALIRAADAAKRSAGLTHSCIFTFRDHPRRVLDADQPQLLTSWREKLSLLRETTIDAVVAADFCPALARLGYAEFVERFLVGFLGMRHMVGGHDVHLGADRGGTADTLAALGRELGFDFTVVDAVTLPDGGVISSSVVRSLLREGDVARAGVMLGRPYSVWGEVGYGSGEGSRLGYPTANIEPLDTAKMLPAPGVYAVRVHLPGDVITEENRHGQLALARGKLPEVDRWGDPLGVAGAARGVFGGMLNHGRAPTVHAGGLPAPRLEVHILDFTGYIRERSIKIEWIARLRDEQTFASVDALRAQLRDDEGNVRRLLGVEHR